MAICWLDSEKGADLLGIPAESNARTVALAGYYRTDPDGRAHGPYESEDEAEDTEATIAMLEARRLDGDRFDSEEAYKRLDETGEGVTLLRAGDWWGVEWAHMADFHDVNGGNARRALTYDCDWVHDEETARRIAANLASDADEEG